MNTLASSQLSNPCFYRSDGAFCEKGILYEAKPSELLRGITKDGKTDVFVPILVEGTPVQCPACEGKGRILTPQGRELFIFCQTYLRPLIYEMVEEAVEDKL
jgi:hypothetical protein